MGHYTKLAVVGLRCMGMLILCYTLPVIGYGLLSFAGGASTASDGVTSMYSSLLGWVAYAFAGLIVFFLAEPLARIAARGVENR